MTLIIPFPSKRRSGHARKIADQLSRSRSDREAEHILSRALNAYERQMHSASIPDAEIDLERSDFIFSIYEECRKLGSAWRPMMPGETA
ncbi:DUF6074 family protein [Neorhizobium sp. LjRoot104]|uniref:DUF6074 family protein n=1 Tax=Neorhizobium sp. LjRoot104 TaxID=3342254 RepID=UPI003ECE0E80